VQPGIHRITAARLYFIPVQTRVPLKFGHETLTTVTCARVALRVADERGREAEGWGETPLSVQWVWPSAVAYEDRHNALKQMCRQLTSAWMEFPVKSGHPLELGNQFIEQVLPALLSKFNGRLEMREAMPHLAALACNSPFDIALHDAFGRLVERPIYSTYGSEFLKSDLSRFIEPGDGCSVSSFRGIYPSQYLVRNPPRQLRAWHLVGGLDLLEPSELTGSEPKDGHPVCLVDWIQRDGLKCLKIKLRGNDAQWDYDRVVKVGQIAAAGGVEHLTVDFNCTVEAPAYVNDILDQLKKEYPRIYEAILYVEQPFPYDLEKHRIDVHSVSSRKLLFLDESAHDWRHIRLGRELGWTGVALKTCKTQTGALLSACWAKAHGMALMVQDLTNPMLAQIPHVLLAAHVGTIMGVETNSMQFYPAASEPEEAIHPGLYQRRNGDVDLSTISGAGFGYRLAEIHRTLPPAEIELAL
jgi:L-alanine-DL-glutamate epimerase-like enolase superfamily enzyme